MKESLAASIKLFDILYGDVQQDPEIASNTTWRLDASRMKQ